MRFRLSPHDPLNETDIAQLRRIVALQRGQPGYDGSVDHLEAERYEVRDGEVHRYDAWVIIDGPLVVFAPGGTADVAWWSDQDENTDDFPDADAVFEAYAAR